VPSNQATSIRAALAAQTLSAPYNGTGNAGGATALVAQFLVLATDASLTAERVFTPGAGLTGADAGAGLAYTLGVDATVARSTWPVSAGAGLTGGGNLAAAGITLSLSTPGTVSITSINAAAAPHTHAVTSSNAPGASASLLATDSSGNLTLSGILRLNSNLDFGGDVDMSRKGANILQINSGDSIESLSYTSGLAGWHIGADGNAEFQNILARGEFQASVFKVSEITATAGTFGVFLSAAAVASDYTAPASIGSSNTLVAKNSSVGGSLLATNDILRIKSYDGTAVRDLWFTVTAVGANSGPSTSYTVRLEAGTVGVTFKAGTAIADYGPNGAGFITLSADGTLGHSANITIADHDATWVGSNPNKAFTTNLRVRLGNLNGSFGLSSDLYGIGIGDYSGGNYLKYDGTNGFTLSAGNSAVSIGAGGIGITGETSGVYTSSKSYHFIDTNAKTFGGVYGQAIPGSPGTYGTFLIADGTVAGEAIAVVDVLVELSSRTTGAGRTSRTNLSAFNNLGSAPALDVISTDTHNYAAFSSSGTLDGLVVGAFAVPNAMLDVRGSGIVTGGLNVGSATSAATGDARLSGTVWPGPAAGTGATGVAGQRAVLASNATAQIFNGGSFGTLFVHDQSAGVTAIYMLRGGGHATAEISDVFGSFTNTKGTVTSINIYWDTTAYFIQNTNAASHTIDMVLLGSP